MCSFSNTGANRAWPPQNRGIETERFSKARSICLHHNIKAWYIVGLKIKIVCVPAVGTGKNKCFHIYTEMTKWKAENIVKNVWQFLKNTIVSCFYSLKANYIIWMRIRGFSWLSLISVSLFTGKELLWYALKSICFTKKIKLNYSKILII